MDRPKQRRLIFLALLLLAGGALLLLRWNGALTPKEISALSATATKQVAEPQPAETHAATNQAAESIVTPPTVSKDSAGLRGRIVDAVTREPVKEFDVQLIRVRREGYTEDQPITRSFNSPTGYFSWTKVAAGTWRAAISAPGYQLFNVPELQITEGAAPDEIVVPLLRGLAVHGRVFDMRTGAGIDGAYISFKKTGERETFGKSQAQTRSKQDGLFDLDGIPAGDIVLTVGAPNYAYRELAVFVDKETLPQDIGLSSGATIAGIVTTTAGVRVTGRITLAGPGPGYGVETNDAGEFSFQHMPPGRYEVSADTSAGSATHGFTLGQDEIKQGITLIVGAGRSVRGTLRGLSAERLKNTHIFLQSESGGTSHTARPDERGAYALNGVPSGQAVLRVSAAEIEVEKLVDVPADQDVTVDIAFPAGARLSGRVSRGGRPAANWDIWMAPVDKKSQVLYHARTADDGNYEIERVSSGDYRLRADEDIGRIISITADTVMNIDIPESQVSARVVEEGGAVPIIGANVYARGNAPETARVRINKQTDDFGQFSLTGIEPGEIVLIVYKPGYELHREDFVYSSAIANKTIALRKSAGVEVRVRPGSRRFPSGFTITQTFASDEYVVDLWIPMDGERICRVPGALAGTTFQIGRFSGEPIVIEAWDGQPFELP